MKQLLNYIHNQEDARANFALGCEYEDMGQTGAAISFYLRAAERSTSDIQQYEALLRMAICFAAQRTRDDTEKTILEKAIVLMMHRPEAYFLLSKYHEARQNWQNSYTMACFGLAQSQIDLVPLPTHMGYPGSYALLFQKGVAAWWVGHREESRQIMRDLKLNHDLDQNHQTAVDNNLKTCGWPTESVEVIQPPKQTKIPAVIPIVANSTVNRSCEQVSNNYTKGIWIVDNFYHDPDAIRALALEQEYDHGGIDRYYIGSRTKQQFLVPGLKQEFERIMGEKITRWEEHGMNGRFQYCTEGEPLAHHCDDQKWAGMLYLTPDAPYSTGTSTFALKNTNIRHRDQADIRQAFRPGSKNLDRTIFEPVDILGNVYNRLVIFNAGYLHSPSEYFGFNMQNCRLWQMFFFD